MIYNQSYILISIKKKKIKWNQIFILAKKITQESQGERPWLVALIVETGTMHIIVFHHLQDKLREKKRDLHRIFLKVNLFSLWVNVISLIYLIRLSKLCLGPKKQLTQRKPLYFVNSTGDNAKILILNHRNLFHFVFHF